MFGTRLLVSAAFFLAMPGVASVAEAASTPIFVVPVGEGTLVVVALGVGRRGIVEVLHLNCNRLQLLERINSTNGLEVLSQAVWFNKADVAMLLGNFREDVSTTLAYGIERLVKFVNVLPTFQIFQKSQIHGFLRAILFLQKCNDVLKL
jgi:hypothetical protein